jgi:hypothetical protein
MDMAGEDHALRTVDARVNAVWLGQRGESAAKKDGQ